MVNRVIHFEIPIDDPDRAARFYTDVFGWTVGKFGPVDYWTMTTGVPPGPGAEGALAPRADLPGGVLVYVGVPSVDDALASVRAAGGEPLTEKREIPGIGSMAQFRDPEGNVIGLFEESPDGKTGEGAPAG